MAEEWTTYLKMYTNHPAGHCFWTSVDTGAAAGTIKDGENNQLMRSSFATFQDADADLGRLSLAEDK